MIKGSKKAFKLNEERSDSYSINNWDDSKKRETSIQCSKQTIPINIQKQCRIDCLEKTYQNQNNFQIKKKNKICRLCHGQETKNNYLISPCKCINEQKYIHHSCLLKTVKNRLELKCVICNTNYLYKETDKKVLDYKKIISKLLSQFPVSLVIAFICIFFASFIYLFLYKLEVIQYKDIKIYLLVASLVTCIIVIAFFIYLTVDNVNNFYRVETDLEIFDYQPVIIKYNDNFSGDNNNVGF